MQFWLMGEKIKINLNSRADGFNLVPKIEGLLGLPEIRTSSGVNSGIDGGWTSEQYYQPRMISLSGNIVDFDKLEVAKKRRNLGELLNEKTLKLKYVSEIGEAFFSEVKVIGFTSSLENDGRVFTYKLSLKQDDPLFYQLGDSGKLIATLNIQKATTGFTIPFRLPLHILGGGGSQKINNSGSSSVLPVIVIKNKITNPEVLNKTTKKSIKIFLEMQEGDVLEINNKTKTIIYNGTDAYHLQSEASEFFELVAGDNELVLVSDNQNDEGYAEISYASGFMSI